MMREVRLETVDPCGYDWNIEMVGVNSSFNDAILYEN